MSKVPVIARNLCYETLTNDFWEADYSPGYREREGGGNPTPPLLKEFSPHPNLVVSLKLGVCVNTQAMHQI